MAVWEAKRKTKIKSSISCNQTQPANQPTISRSTLLDRLLRRNDQPPTNPLVNIEKHRKNHSQLPMSTTKSWTFSIFVGTTTTMPRSTVRSILGILIDMERMGWTGGKFAIYFTHHVRISCISKGNWQTAKEMDQEQNGTEQHTIAYSCTMNMYVWKSFWFLLLRLFLLGFYDYFCSDVRSIWSFGNSTNTFRVGSTGSNSCTKIHTHKQTNTIILSTPELA